ncbi:mitochondrial amidoxime-reducing component 1 [Aplysia californica]|uniref:Mitochondrial amidoxime-reducing component 1 n=1 Tax=Aplysia californica TaxID=6500 RepID=A0ABM0K611_APLCA|nr:mitochondrial amidoxime-reducing component 1 [Aplysia californica]XP_005109548.1 mitochondrial amidoxime-reducing component 1 [Aplysia californica]
MSVFDQGSPAALFAAVAAGAAMKYAAGIMFPKQKKEEYRYVGKVGAIWVYPFKSFKGLSVQSADCTALGMQWRSFTDRHWTVSTADGVYLTQRQVPTMALIEPVLNGDRIMLMAPGMDPISFPADPPVTDSNISKVTIKTDTVRSVDMGDAVADWLCRYFSKTGLRLHYSAPNLEKRDASKAKKMWQHPAQPGDMCAFSDYCGYMVLSNASLADLNTRLETAVPITNFRANIIVDDCGAYEEDSWSSIRIGNAQLRALDACTRCVLVTVDQSKGVKDKKEEPLKTLKKFRLKHPYGEKPCFGVNYTLDKCGQVKVGDPIYATLS